MREELAAGFVPPNWIATQNPFGLAEPPLSFRRDLWNYDDRLVIFASNKEAVYRLARIATGKVPWQKLVPGHPDNPVMLKHNLTPLKAIQGYKPAWGQVIINGLAACDVHRVGGGVAASELLDQQEELEARRLDVEIADEASARAGEAYRGIKAQQGSTSRPTLRRSVGAGGTKNPFDPTQSPKKRRPVYRPRGAGDHAIFTGR